MLDNEKFNIEGMKHKIEQEPIPDNIDQYINYGLKKGKNNLNTSSRKRVYLSLITSSLIILFVISVRVSPVFAAYVSNIPGFEKIVNLIRYDQGLQLAVENDFVQHIDISDEHSGIKLTVDDIIIDETRMVIFYTIENNTNERQSIKLNELGFYDEDNTRLKWSHTYTQYLEEIDSNANYQGTIDVYFLDLNEIPNFVTLKTKFQSNTYIDNDLIWEIEIPIDKNKFEGLKDVYVINEAVTIEDQIIYFKKITVYPTRIAVEIEYDKNNSKKILGYDNLRIIDEKGREFASINNGVIGSKLDENKEIVYLQSNYFNRPQELYLKVNSVKSLDKDELNVIVDLENETLIKSPDDKIKLAYINETAENIELIFSLKKEPIDANYQYFIFSNEYSDADGNVYDRTQSESWGGPIEEGYDQAILYRIENRDYPNPINLKIDQYPTRIYGDVNIKVK